MQKGWRPWNTKKTKRVKSKTVTKLSGTQNSKAKVFDQPVHNQKQRCDMLGVVTGKFASENVIFWTTAGAHTFTRATVLTLFL